MLNAKLPTDKEIMSVNVWRLQLKRLSFKSWPLVPISILCLLEKGSAQLIYFLPSSFHETLHPHCKNSVLSDLNYAEGRAAFPNLSLTVMTAKVNDWCASEWAKWRAHKDEGGGGEKGLAPLQV